MPVSIIRVSVIIPNYNHAAFLKERIESILNQTYTDYELIILDDCSTDNSRDIIEQYRLHPKVSHIEYNETNTGSPFRQWQKGIEMAKGEWIWIAESDDDAEPAFLETLLSCIQKYPTAGIIYSNSYKEETDPTNRFKTTAEETNFDFNISDWDHSHLIKVEKAINSYLCKKNIILNASSALMKKKHLIEFLPETTNMKYYADWYLYIRIAAISDIWYCHQLLNTFRRHPESIIHKSKINGIKTDCFRILNLLLKQPQIADKKETINYFTFNYLKPGLKKEGKMSFIKLMSQYFLINPRLTALVAKRIFTKS
jgi:glycosyltransferase involved in cell wall biosynthesis